MAMEYISRQIKDDPAVDAAREKLAKQGTVVPAALDLGMVTLQRAQSMKDPGRAPRRIGAGGKDIPGHSRDGRENRTNTCSTWARFTTGSASRRKARQEFDKLLAKHQRKAEILYALANVLRDLGASAEARKLMEEAYEKSTGRKGAARHRPTPRNHFNQPG